MAYILSGTEIRNPHGLSEKNDTMTAQNRALDGSINRDSFGSNKRVWTLKYSNVLGVEYNIIKTIYDTYLSNNVPVTWEVTETNYTIAETTVHLDLDSREFRVKGEDYISDFTLVITEV
jgi:hypothetical protein